MTEPCDCGDKCCPCCYPASYRQARAWDQAALDRLPDTCDLVHGDHERDWSDELGACGDLPKPRRRRRTAVEV